MRPLNNKLYKQIKKLHSPQARKKSSLYVIEGFKCSQEALHVLSNQDIAAIVLTQSADSNIYNSGKKYVVSEKDFEQLSQTHNPQGILILAVKKKPKKLNFDDDYILVLDKIQDPGNIGTILRTAVVVGLKEVIIINKTVDPFNPKAIRAGMGAQFNLNFGHFDSLKQLITDPRLQNHKIWLTNPNQGTSCYDKNFVLSNSILVFGQEAKGISDFSVGEKTMIPTLGNINSLNVAQAVTIYLFEGLRQKLAQ